MGIDTETLSDLVVKTHLSNYEIVDGLVWEYGFKSLFFWQPVLIVGGKSLTGEEQEMKPERDPSLIELYKSVYSRVQQVANKYKNLYYMASIFDEFKPVI
jgi:hypothetical protein